MKYFYLFCGLWICQVSYAQYRPEYSHFMLNNYLINPAVTGIESYGDMQIGYRRQWMGIEGSPQTAYLSFHTPIGLRQDQGFSRTFTQQTTVSNRLPKRSGNTKHGIGGMLLSDQIGPFSRFHGYISYAVHKPLTEKFTLSLGASFGVMHNTINPDKVSLHDPNDPAIYNFSGEFSLDGGIGLWGYSEKFYAGLAITDINAFSTGENSVASPFSDMHVLLTGGMNLPFHSSLSLLPSLQIRTIGNDAFTWQAALRLMVKNRFWVGSGYRFESDVILMTGMYISDLLSFAYAYDAGVGAPSQYSTGSHELTLGLRLFNKNKVICPQFLW